MEAQSISALAGGVTHTAVAMSGQRHVTGDVMAKLIRHWRFRLEGQPGQQVYVGLALEHPRQRRADSHVRRRAWHASGAPSQSTGDEQRSEHCNRGSALHAVPFIRNRRLPPTYPQPDIRFLRQ